MLIKKIHGGKDRLISWNNFSIFGYFLYICAKNFSIMETSKETVAKIVNKIREIRKQKGYSNEAMATDLEMSTSSYNKK